MSTGEFPWKKDMRVKGGLAQQLAIKDMKLKVVVEGIETEEMVGSFSQMGVDEIQGFYYSRPIPPEEFEIFMEKNR